MGEHHGKRGPFPFAMYDLSTVMVKLPRQTCVFIPAMAQHGPHGRVGITTPPHSSQWDLNPGVQHSITNLSRHLSSFSNSKMAPLIIVSRMSLTERVILE